jgi:nickel/cobalt transporter (NicO) family protein
MEVKQDKGFRGAHAAGGWAAACDIIRARRPEGSAPLPEGGCVTSTAILLFLSSCATAVIHALIPDHWLPFLLMSRSQGWSERRTATLTGLAGFLHVLMSIVVGALVILLGATSARGLAERAGQSLEFLAGLFLLVFGLVYGIWAHLREAQVHARPPRTRQGEPEAGGPGTLHTHGHLHGHGHLLERWFREAVSGGALVVIIGISPCALLAPILFAASTEGPGALLAAALGFATCTIVTMVTVTLFARRGMRRFELPFFTRYGDLISGVLIAIIGLLIMRFEA